MTKLHRLELAMSKEADRCAPTLLRLLNHEDVRVKINAASYCIKAQMYIEVGIETLTQIEQESKSHYYRMCASNCKKYCKPFDS